jgi:hypothetical protein
METWKEVKKMKPNKKALEVIKTVPQELTKIMSIWIGVSKSSPLLTTFQPNKHE